MIAQASYEIKLILHDEYEYFQKTSKILDDQHIQDH